MPVNINKNGKKKKKHVNLPALPSEGALEASRAHKAILSLGSDRVAQLVSKIMEGSKLTALVHTIQNEWGELKTMKPDALLKELSRFRKDRVTGKLLWLSNTQYGKEALATFEGDVDVVMQLSKLAQMQQERVSKAYYAEQSLSVLGWGVRLEIETLARIYGQLATLQMDLGLIRRVPKEMVLASVEMAASKAGQVLEEAISRDKRVGARLVKAFALLEGEFTDLVADDAGVYRPAA